MGAPPSTVTALVLMLALGVRHGLDPEHIALVNAVTLRANAAGRRWPSLGGLYFALGHGLVITAVALGLTQLLGLAQWPSWLMTLGAWLPAAILFLVATVNLRDLLRTTGPFSGAAVKLRLLPGPLRSSTHPISIFIIGMLFAPFVDPATQAAVWGYVVGTTSGVWRVAGLGTALTAAMAVTCVLEARAILQLARSADTARAERRQRALGWVIVALSYAVVANVAFSAMQPAAPVWATIGESVAAVALGALAIVAWRRRARRVAMRSQAA